MKSTLTTILTASFVASCTGLPPEQSQALRDYHQKQCQDEQKGFAVDHPGKVRSVAECMKGKGY